MIINSGTRDQIVGKFHEMRGDAKAIAGSITRNPKLAAEGNLERRAGRLLKKVGKIKTTLGM